MSRKRMFYFSLTVVLLLVSEYIFLDELLYNHRPPLLLLGVAGIFSSILLIIRFYKLWRSTFK